MEQRGGGAQARGVDGSPAAGGETPGTDARIEAKQPSDPRMLEAWRELHVPPRELNTARRRSGAVERAAMAATGAMSRRVVSRQAGHDIEERNGSRARPRHDPGLSRAAASENVTPPAVCASTRNLAVWPAFACFPNWPDFECSRTRRPAHRFLGRPWCCRWMVGKVCGRCLFLLGLVTTTSVAPPRVLLPRCVQAWHVHVRTHVFLHRIQPADDPLEP